MKDSIKYKGYTIEVKQDEYAENPLKEFDCLGRVGYLIGSRYTLGDVALPQSELNRIENDTRNYIAVPVYAYVHSGATVKASENGNPFHCPWDSGQSGIVFVKKSKVREEYGWGRITKEREEEIKQHLINEVRLFNHWVSGNVYGYQIEETGDSCWGFYGDDFNESGLLDDAKSQIDCIVENDLTIQAENNG